MDTGLLCRDSEKGTNKVHNQEGVTSLNGSPIYGIHDLKIKEQVPLPCFGFLLLLMFFQFFAANFLNTTTPTVGEQQCQWH